LPELTSEPTRAPRTCADALRGAGALAIPRAIDERICAGLIDAMNDSPAAATRPISPQTMQREHDRAFVRSATVAASPFAHAIVELALAHHRPRLEHFFGRPLELNPELHFLTYAPGGFIRPHVDVMEGDGVLEKIRERLVVFTLFLNGAERPEGHTFAGGEFVLHPAPDRDLVLTCKPGILVAFKAALAHSVRPVSAGTRHAVSGWFRAPRHNARRATDARSE
jgi:predicted 2-oxoglutarate/Fe(II)-dependent dioxygenase YbiX